MIRYYGKTGTLTVNSLVLNGPAWDVPDVTPLWNTRAWVGTNVGLAGVDGTRPARRRLDEMSVVLAGIVVGDVDPDGDAYSTDAAEGMYVNQGLMRTALMDPHLVGGDPTLPMTLLLPGGAGTLEGEVQCDLRFGKIVGSQSWRYSRCTFALGLVVNAGALTLATGS